MPGPILHVGATVLCSHAGQTTATVPNPRVMVSGQPVTGIAAPWSVMGCTMPPPSAGNGPCVTAQWMSGSMRVLADGQPMAIATSQATCAPTATPAMPTVFQTRVIAS